MAGRRGSAQALKKHDIHTVRVLVGVPGGEADRVVQAVDVERVLAPQLPDGCHAGQRAVAPRRRCVQRLDIDVGEERLPSKGAVSQVSWFTLKSLDRQRVRASPQCPRASETCQLSIRVLPMMGCVTHRQRHASLNTACRDRGCRQSPALMPHQRRQPLLLEEAVREQLLAVRYPVPPLGALIQPALRAECRHACRANWQELYRGKF